MNPRDLDELIGRIDNLTGPATTPAPQDAHDTAPEEYGEPVGFKDDKPARIGWIARLRGKIRHQPLTR